MNDDDRPLTYGDVKRLIGWGLALWILPGVIFTFALGLWMLVEEVSSW